MSDRLFGIVVACVALAFMLSATQVQTSFLTDPVGPKLFPILIGGIAFLCAILIVLKPDDEPQWPPAKTFAALAVCVLVLVAYAYTLKPLGFIIPTAVAAAALSYQIEANLRKAVLTGIGLSIGLFVLFKYVLGLGLFAFSRQLTGG